MIEKATNGRGTRSRRDRAFPHDQPEGGDGGQYQAQHDGAAQGRQRQGLDCGLRPVIPSTGRLRVWRHRGAARLFTLAPESRGDVINYG
jgi:hypothetical protein